MAHKRFAVIADEAHRSHYDNLDGYARHAYVDQGVWYVRNYYKRQELRIGPQSKRGVIA